MGGEIFNACRAPYGQPWFVHLRWSYPRGTVVQASGRICLFLNGLAVSEKGVERLDLIKEQAIVHHVLVVGSELGQGAVVRNEAKTARDRGVVVDQATIQVFLGEEDVLVIGHRVRQRCVCNRRVGEAGGIQASHVVPMASEPIPASKGTLRAEDVNGRGFSLEGPLGTHHLLHRFRQLDALQVCGCIAVNGAQFARLAGGSRAKFEHDCRRDIARSRSRGRVVDEHLVAFGPDPGP